VKNLTAVLRSAKGPSPLHLRSRSLVPLLGLLGALGCAKTEECTRARLTASDAWKTVMSQAGEARLTGSLDFEDLPGAKKAEHVKAFTQMEKQAEMVFTSFAYEKITWKTSDPARAATDQAFNGYFGKDNYKILSAALKTANDKYEAVAKACRD